MLDYHPVISILVEHHNLSLNFLTKMKDQLEPHRKELMGLKELLLKHKLTQESTFQQAIAEYYELEYKEYFEEVREAQQYTEYIPIRYAKKFMIFPVEKQGFVLNVAVLNPENSQPVDDLSRQFNCRVRMIVSHREAILDLINRAYNLASTSTEDAVENLDTEENFESILALEEPEDLLDAEDEEPVKRLVNSLLWQAAKDEASDVHIDPSPKATRVRYRIDGVLYQITTVPRQVHVTVANRIKVMSRLDIAQKGLPQDGRTMVLIAGKKIDIRVSTIPTVHGEKVVMRLLYQSANLMQLEELGISPNIFQSLNQMIHKTGGIVLVTGPTGSGKTTTLYASLGKIDHQSRNVITIEDPVEYKMSGYSQIEINAKLGLTFATALRSVLRQDPDVIMVGEMRDAETAQIAIQAALTGHLVFSTVHTNSAPATITRLIDMGTEPFLVSSTIIGVLAQRLVRTICQQCKIEYQPHLEQLRELMITEEMLKQHGGVFYRGVGCEACRGSGYRGRAGIHELLVMNDAVKNTILRTSDANEIKRTAMQHQMVTLRMDGVSKIFKGSTTIEEVLSITNEDESDLT